MMKITRDLSKSGTRITSEISTKDLKIFAHDGSLESNKIHLILGSKFLKDMIQESSDDFPTIIVPDFKKGSLTKLIEIASTGETYFDMNERDDVFELLFEVMKFDLNMFTSSNEKRKKKKTLLPVESPSVCRFCGKHFIESFARKEHEETIHLNRTEYPCSECDITFRTVKGLKTHTKNKHSSNPKRYDCNLCDKSYANKSDLKRHCKTDHNEEVKTYKCDLCKYVAKRKDHLYSHLKFKHQQYNLKVSAIRQHFIQNESFTCDKCDKEFYSDKDTIDHLSNECEDLWCKICKKPYSSKSNYKKHMNKYH